MLFLNRRGYAPLLICRDCGHRIQCPHCTAWLAEHRITGELICHHCGFKMFTPKRCPECGSEDGLTACGPGVERIAEEVRNRFPEARTAILSSDITTNYKQISDVIHRTANKEIDILIGTQILAKGHNFPDLTLVGVVDADLGLMGTDLRASEQTFQLLAQVSGRAGRGEKKAWSICRRSIPTIRYCRRLSSITAKLLSRLKKFAAAAAYAPLRQTGGTDYLVGEPAGGGSGGILSRQMRAEHGADRNARPGAGADESAARQIPLPPAAQDGKNVNIQEVLKNGSTWSRSKATSA